VDSNFGVFMLVLPCCRVGLSLRPWHLSCLFKDVCVPLVAIPGRTSLLAADRGDLLVPSTKTKIGGRSFRVEAPTVWNSLPLHLHNKTNS